MPAQQHNSDHWTAAELLPFASGILLALSMPPLKLPFLSLIAIVPLLFYLEQAATVKQIAWAGITTSLVFFGINLNWLIAVGAFSWLIYPAYLSILFIYTCNFFVFILVIVVARSFLGIDFLYTAPFAWVVSERLRASGDIAFPWSTFGYSLTSAPFFLQFADLVGVYGVSFVLIALNVLLYKAVRERRYAIAWIAIVLILNAYNVYRWFAPPPAADRHINVAVIQPNVPQRLKWEAGYSLQIVRNLLAMQQRALQTRPELVVWPETAIPFYIDERRPFALTEMGPLPQNNSYILTGTLNVGYSDAGLAHFYNSAVLFDPAGTMLERYKKIVLVPASELFPFRAVLGFTRTFFDIHRVTYGAMEPGNDATVFSLPNAKFSVLICYESVFPRLASNFRRGGAQFLVNITNDAWFGRSWGPYQHASFLVMRAIENRLPIVRCANTGVSGFVDAKGRWTQKSGIFTQSIMSASVPVTSPMTFYTRSGDLVVYACVAVVALLTVRAVMKKVREA